MDTILALLNFDWLPPNIALYIAALTTVFTAAKSITILTPTTHDDKFVNFALKILNFLALNIFRDKNADAVKPPPTPPST